MMVSAIVDAGAVPALVKHLQGPPIHLEREVNGEQLPFEHEVEKESAFALGLLAVKVMMVGSFISIVICLTMDYGSK